MPHAAVLMDLVIVMHENSVSPVSHEFLKGLDRPVEAGRIKREIVRLATIENQRGFL